MSDAGRLARLATALYALAIVLFLGTLLELAAAKHFGEPLQFVPSILCALGLVVTALAWRHPSGGVVAGQRILMVALIAGSLLGVWEHIEGNLGFIREMHPDTVGWPLIVGALTGRAPLLASGALAVAGAVAMAATYAAQPRAAVAEGAQERAALRVETVR